METKQDLLARLLEISSEQLGVEQEQITADSTWAQLGADSLDRLQMSRAIEDAFHVEIPHTAGERLNTVGETVDHLWSLMETGTEALNIQIERATTNQQWAEISRIRTQVFGNEFGYSFQHLPGPGEKGVWHFLARGNHNAIGALSVVDTTGDNQLHDRYRLSFMRNERVARYAQLAILRPYRKRGIFRMLLESAQKTVIRPNEFAVGWLLYSAEHAHSCKLTQELGFTPQSSVLATEFGRCRVLVRREAGPAKVNGAGAASSMADETFPRIETCAI